MICEHCKHVFVPPPQPPMVSIRRVCPRCCTIIDDKFYRHPAFPPWYDIRRYKATCNAVKVLREACDAGAVKVDWAETPSHSHRRIINGIGWWVK
jgi:hypothetical protein